MMIRMKNRYKEIKMLHIGLGSGFWHPYDVIYVVTGRVYF